MRTHALSHREAQMFRRLVQLKLWLFENFRKARRDLRSLTRVAPWFRLAIRMHQIMFTSLESSIDRHRRLLGGRPPQIL